MDEIKDEVTALCFMNIQWFARLRDIIDESGYMDAITLDFIEHCQAENKTVLEKYRY